MSEGLSESDLGTYLAVERLIQLGQIDQEINKLIAEAQETEKERQELNNTLAVRDAILRGSVQPVMS